MDRALRALRISKLAHPVAVWVITSVLAFGSGFVFNFVFGQKSVPEYPLYCVVDSYNDERGAVLSDILLINLTTDTLTEALLAKRAHTAAAEQKRTIDPLVRLRLRVEHAHILDVTEDSLFNRGNGSIEIEQSNGLRTIRVKEVRPERVMKLTLVTDLHRLADRGAAASAWVECEYPGR